MLFQPYNSNIYQGNQKQSFLSWPGLTVKLVKKYLDPSVTTAKGHLRQEQQGLQSTHADSTLTVNRKVTEEEDTSPTIDRGIKSTNAVIYAVVRSDNKAYMDLCGRFPYVSSRGNKYIMIGYHYEANAILGLALKNRQAKTLTNGWKYLHNLFTTKGLKPTTWVLDNETSAELHTAMEKYKTTFQLVPPHIHRANAAEKAIQTFKSHFKPGLSSLNADYDQTRIHEGPYFIIP